MGELKLYSVTDDYISFLQSMYSNVYSNKQESRTHTRKYKELVSDEMIYIRKNRHRIIQNAEEVYHQKIHQDESAKYIKTALDFEWLEILCDMFVKKKTRCQQRLSYYFRNYKRNLLHEL